MSRSIDEVQDIILPVLHVLHLDCMAFDGYPLFFFKIHRIKHLVFHVPFTERPCRFKQPVGQRAFTVIYMRNYREIPNIFHFTEIYGANIAKIEKRAYICLIV